MEMDFKKFYNEHDEYHEQRFDEEKIRENDIITNYKAATLLKIIPKEIKFNSVLEIGCSNGILLHKVSQKLNIKNVFGVDISSKNIEFAKEKYPHINFFFGFLEDFTEVNKTHFDLVILSDIVEHVQDDVDFLKKICQITDYVVYNLPCEKSYHFRNRVYGPEDSSGHLRWYSVKDSRSLIEKTGFTIIKEQVVIDIKESKDWYNYNLEKRKKSISGKKTLKKIKWKLFFFAFDFTVFYMPFVYIKIFGCNHFAFLKSNCKTK